LREFSEPPNLNLNEGVRAMRTEMENKNLYPPIFLTYPLYDDSVKVVLFNEEQPTEWEKIKKYLEENKYINNKIARDISGITQNYKMSRLLRKWTDQGFLTVVTSENNAPKYTKYKLSNKNELDK